MLRNIKTKYGQMYYYKNDRFIGSSLEYYGEYTGLEIDYVKPYIQDDDIIIDIGPEGGTQFFMAEAVYSVQIKPIGRAYTFAEAGGVRRPIPNTSQHRQDTDFSIGIGFLLFNRIDVSFGITTGTVIVKSYRFGGINIDL